MMMTEYSCVLGLPPLQDLMIVAYVDEASIVSFPDFFLNRFSCVQSQSYSSPP